MHRVTPTCIAAAMPNPILADFAESLPRNVTNPAMTAAIAKALQKTEMMAARGVLEICWRFPAESKGICPIG